MSLSEEERFAENTTVMVDLVHHTVTIAQQRGLNSIHPDLVKLAGIVMSKYDKHELIQGFIEKSHEECWDMIKIRDVTFFTKNASAIFKHLPTDKVDLFRDLFVKKDANGNSYISAETEKNLWDLFTSMIKISIKYIHKNRSPTTTSDGKKVYKSSFFDEVDIAKHAKNFNLTLTF